jgi:hypothetical protein
VAFVYDGLLLLNVSLAAFPDVKLWQVRWCCGEGGMGRRQCPAVELRDVRVTGPVVHHP